MSEDWTPPLPRPLTPPRPLPLWEEVGRRLAGALDDRSAAVVVGDDPEAAAQVALGIGRIQAMRRRVAVGDLVGELKPLEELVTADAPHGISDSFLFGVSLNRIAHPADESQNLFVLPSGTEPVAVREILTSDRWRRLAQGFASEGALLLLVAPADAPGIQELVDSLDGAVILGGAGRTLGDSTRVIALARAPHEGRMPAPRPADIPRPIMPREEPAPGAAPRGLRRVPWLAALALLVGLIVVALLVSRALQSRPVPSPAPRDSTIVAQPPAPAPAAPPVVAPAPPDTVAAPALTPANPQDSAAAAAWAVELALAETPEGARQRIADARVAAAATVSPAVIGAERARWYRVVVGALATREEAEALRDDLRARNVLLADGGKIVRAPLALLLVDSVPAAGTPAAMQPFEQRGLSPYALVRPDGRASIYAGAFETPADAAALAAAARRLGVTPRLAYRVGRAIP